MSAKYLKWFFVNLKAFSKIQCFIYIIENKPSIIGVTESWANCDIRDSELNLKGYELFRKDRDIKNEKGNDKKVVVFRST